MDFPISIFVTIDDLSKSQYNDLHVGFMTDKNEMITDKTTGKKLSVIRIHRSKQKRNFFAAKKEKVIYSIFLIHVLCEIHRTWEIILQFVPKFPIR